MIAFPRQVGRGKLDAVRREIDRAHVRPGTGELQKVDSNAATYLEHLLSLISGKPDVVAQIVDLVVTVALESIEELRGPNGKVGDLDIVDELVPIRPNVLERGRISHGGAGVYQGDPNPSSFVE